MLSIGVIKKDMDQSVHLLNHIWSKLSKYQLDIFKMKKILLSRTKTTTPFIYYAKKFIQAIA